MEHDETLLQAEQRFRSDVEQHVLTVLRDDIAHRHLRFKSPSTTENHFDIITWPNYLCIVGDCGSFVFERTYDMLAFFAPRDVLGEKPLAAPIYINPHYWSEKVEAADHSGVKRHSEAAFRSAVDGYVQPYLDKLSREEEALRLKARSGPLAEEDEWRLDKLGDIQADFASAVQSDVLEYAADGPLAHHAVHVFEHEGFRFEDWEHDATEFTPRFLWCLRAIVWGTRLYGLAKQQASKEPAHG